MMCPTVVLQGGEPALGSVGHYHFDWKEAEERGDYFFRTDHPLGQAIIDSDRVVSI